MARVEATSTVFPRAGRIHHDRRSHDEVSFLVQEVFGDGAYTCGGVHLSPGATVFDAGANIGLFSIWAWRACGGSASIYAFEPIPSTFEFLAKNLEEHGVEAKAYRAGLGPIGGPKTAVFTTYAGLPGNATLHPEEKRGQLDAYLQGVLRAQREQHPIAYPLIASWIRRRMDDAASAEEVECRLTSVSEIAAQHGVERIDLLKIDVEGAELGVLLGLDDALWPRVSQIVLETHGEASAEEIERLGRARGFSRVTREQPRWARAYGLDNFTVALIR
jgi:FkbM family methyltransferase